MAGERQLTDEELDEMIRQALLDATWEEARMLMEDNADIEVAPPSLHSKRRLNHIFRALAGAKIPYPEVDTPWRCIADRIEYRARRMVRHLSGKRHR